MLTDKLSLIMCQDIFIQSNPSDAAFGLHQIQTGLHSNSKDLQPPHHLSVSPSKHLSEKNVISFEGWDARFGVHLFKQHTHTHTNTHFSVGTMLCCDFISLSRYHRHLPCTLLRLFNRSCSAGRMDNKRH